MENAGGNVIQHHLVHAARRLLVELTRLRHLQFRAKSAASETLRGANVVPAGVQLSSYRPNLP